MPRRVNREDMSNIKVVDSCSVTYFIFVLYDNYNLPILLLDLFRLSDPCYFVLKY